ncbi:PilN domain-containing protein [Nitrincola tapanii]|uniref:Pilus assembly protein PilN n=1 Tax=Nitrincola tapanii TaxID=1708751 RepID=A0A5A9W7V9_9GAMM|nr:PilN domain-containing protein [Nitrincola tapanii]KAA0876265.1 pilus assembly protein PilN [Nitrincola tapanii]
MARINLRPWREERNQALQKRFISNLVGTAILAGLALFAISYYYDMQMDRQKARNEFLRVENVKLDQQIAEIRELNRIRDQILERLQSIEDLQGTRPLIVRNFDELVRVLPEEVFYTSLVRVNNNLTIDGMAEQNHHVSALMRNLQRSIWFGEPNLSRVSAVDSRRQYNMTVPMLRPDQQEGAVQ